MTSIIFLVYAAWASLPVSLISAHTNLNHKWELEPFYRQENLQLKCQYPWFHFIFFPFCVHVGMHVCIHVFTHVHANVWRSDLKSGITVNYFITLFIVADVSIKVRGPLWLTLGHLLRLWLQPGSHDGFSMVSFQIWTTTTLSSQLHFPIFTCYILIPSHDPPQETFTLEACAVTLFSINNPITWDGCLLNTEWQKTSPPPQ